MRATRTGRVLRVTEALARATLGREEEVIEVCEKDPSVQAFTDLMSGALDKPREQPREFTSPAMMSSCACCMRVWHARPHRRISRETKARP